MKILLATDGSEGSAAALEALVSRPWPAASEVLVLSVAFPYPYYQDPFLAGAAIYGRILDEEVARATNDAARAVEQIQARAPQLAVRSATPVGSPSAVAIDLAREWGADLILVGSHGRGAAGRFLLGSVSNAIALHASCSVEIVRQRKA